MKATDPLNQTRAKHSDAIGGMNSVVEMDPDRKQKWQQQENSPNTSTT